MKKANCIFTFLFFMLFTGILANGQITNGIYFDKEIKANNQELPPKTLLTDMYGYPWESKQKIGGTHNEEFTGIQCSSFKIVFADYENGTGIGYDDPAPVTLTAGHPLAVELGTVNTTLGALRRWTACSVFRYISETISIPSGIVPDIYFAVSETDGADALAYASPLFSTGYPVNSFVGGLLRDHIVTGIDPTPNAGDFDAFITTDFGTNGIWSINGQSVPINSDGYSTTAPGIDLYSVLLHEATHALGFFSNIQQNSTSALTNTTTGKYSIFDSFTKLATDANANSAPYLINTSSFTFQGDVADLTSNQLKSYGVIFSKPYSVYAPSAWKNGSSLSHFDNVQDINENYIMKATYAGGIIRTYAKPELEILCQLGYTITNPDFACGDRFAVGVDDLATGTLGGTVTKDVIANDYDADLQTPALDAASVSLLTNAGTISISGNTITFVSDGAYSGDVIIKYRPYTVENGRKGSYATFKIKIPYPGYCPIDPCNYICNGGFEEGLTLAQFDVIAASSFAAGNYRTVASGGIPGWHDLGAQEYSADCFFRGSQVLNTLTNPPTPLFGAPLNFFANAAPGVETPSANNNRYTGFIQGNTAWGSEGIYRELVKPLIPGENYLLTYSVRAIRFTNNGPGTSNTPAYLNTSFSTTEPPADGINTPAFAGDNFISSPVQLTNSSDAANNWTSISIPFQAAQASAYIIFQPPLANDGHYYFVDNIRLIKAGNQVSVVTTSSAENPAIGQSVVFSIKVCNTGTSALTNVGLHNSLPVGFTMVSNTLNTYPDHTFVNLNAGECVTLTVTATVNSDVALNTDLNDCAAVTTANACAQTQSCITEKILAADISVSCVQGTSCNQFSAIISNVGAADAHNVHLSYVPPSCFGYSSYAFTNGAGTYAFNIITLPLVPAGGSVTIVFTGNPTVTSGCINTVTLSGAYDEIDLNPSNNSGSVTTGSECGGLWPKAYGSNMYETFAFVKDNFGNNIIGASQIEFNPNLNYNHVGVFPTSNTVQAIHYNNNGVTSWLSQNSLPLFAFKSGIIQMEIYNSVNQSFVNGATGVSVSPPLNLQQDERMFAESNSNKFIALQTNIINGAPHFKLNVHTSSALLSTIDIGEDYVLGKYNPITDNLFVWSFFNVIKLYHFDGSTFNYVSSVNLPFTPPYGNLSTVQIDDNDGIYFIEHFTLKRFDFFSGTLTNVNIPGFNNTNIIIMPHVSNYTANRCVVFNKGDNYIYYLDLSNNISKKILTLGVNGMPSTIIWDTKVAFENNDIYLFGYYNSATQIGNQVMPLFNSYEGLKVFFTKLNLQTDFTFRQFQTLGKNRSDLQLSISPNPVTNMVNLNIQSLKKKSIDLYSVTITNKMGRMTFHKKNSLSSLKINISTWEHGVYYIEAINSKNEKVTSSFIKL